MNKNYFKIIPFFLLGLMFLMFPNIAQAKTYSNFSDFDNYSWESLNYWRNSGLVSFENTAWYGTAEAGSYIGKNSEGKKLHSFNVTFPYEDQNDGCKRKDLHFKTNYLVCADSFYNQIKDKNDCNISVNVDDLHSWQIDTEQDENKTTATIDGKQTNVKVTNSWPEGFENGVQMQAIVLNRTFELYGDGARYVQGTYDNYQEGAKEQEYINGKWVVYSHYYIAALICVPTTAEFNLNMDGGSNHVFFNQWLICFFAENIDTSVDNIRQIKSYNSEDKTSSYEDVQNSSNIVTRYENNKTNAEYSRTTPPSHVNSDTTTFSSYTEKITKHQWYGVVGGKLIVDSNSPAYYNSASYPVVQKTIKYTTTLPNLIQTKFTPYTLNRNGTSQKGDGNLDSSFLNKTALSCLIQNNQTDADSKNNVAIKTLDTNSDNNFTFKFNAENSVLGLCNTVDGKNYDWLTTPTALTNKTYEDVLSESSYANGRRGNNPDGAYRYNAIFKASTCLPNGGSKDNPTSSLLLNKEETTAYKLLTKTYPFSGGDYSTRFTYIGDYETFSGENSDKIDTAKYNNWWIDDYDQSKFYEYGTYYHGYIDLNGIYNPNIVAKGTYTESLNSLETEKTFNININANNEERGLYVGCLTEKMIQPVLYGKWKVTSIAGTID